MDDRYFMSRAIALAGRAWGMTSPNPMVGAVVVKNGRIIAEDFHRMPGTLHAEALALEKAGKQARGSTLYISLEPCCHTDKRTPPCAKTIIRSGVRRVVVAMKDPNPKVSGRGLREMEEAGIMVKTGELEDRARKLNETYIKYITTRRPFVTLKVAMTLDGKIATPEGQSRWITGEKARRMVHRLRAGADAILTAIGTVRADDPELTVRLGRSSKSPLPHKPVRIVIDPNLDVPPSSKILRTPPETVIVARETAEQINAYYLVKSGVNIIKYKESLDLRWLMGRLGEGGITSVLIEGGSSLNSHALRDRVVDKVVFFIAPKIIGGRESYPAVGGKEFQRLEDAFRLSDVRVWRAGEDIVVEGYLAS